MNIPATYSNSQVRLGSEADMTQHFFSRGKFRRGIAAFIAFCLTCFAVIGSPISSAPAHAAPGDPFPDNGMGAVWVVLSGTDSVLYQGRQTNDSLFLESLHVTPSTYYNALSFNVNDRYLYAMTSRAFPSDGGRHLLRIGQGGVIFDLGPVAGLPDFTNGYGYYAGTFGSDDTGSGGIDSSNILYIAASSGDLQGQTVYGIDVTTQTVVSTNVVITVSAGKSYTDFIWAFGYLWGIRNNTSVLSRFDLTTNTQLDINFAGSGVPAAPWAAKWRYGNGNFGAADVIDGFYYQFRINDPTSASPTVSLVAKADLGTPSIFGGDGASDPGSATDLGVLKTGQATFGPGGTITWSMTVTNYGPFDSSGWVLHDTLPAGLTNPSTSTSFCNITQSSSGYLLTCVGNELLAYEDAPPIVLTAEVPANWNLNDTSISGVCPGAITNVASVLGNEEDQNPDNDTSSATSCPGELSWEKVAAEDEEMTLGGSSWKLSGPHGLVLVVPDNVGQAGYLGADLDTRAGIFRVSGFSAGDYALVEMLAPKGYALDPTVHQVTLDSQQTHASFGRIVNQVLPAIQRTEALAKTGSANQASNSPWVFLLLAAGLLAAAQGRRKRG